MLFFSVSLLPNLKIDVLVFFVSMYTHILSSKELFVDGGPRISKTSFLLDLLTTKSFDYFL